MLKAEELFIPETASILDAMKRLDETGQRILFVAPEGRLKAVVTDGDIRKCMLRGGSLEDPISNAANYHPKSLPIAERGRARSEMEHWGIDALPILDRSGVITDIVFADGV
ncbi:MAG: CBS domain-containing protein, partial [Gemmiger sp.]